MPEQRNPGPENEEELVELISVQGEMNARVLVSILEGEGIDVMIKSNQTFGALPFTVDGMGEVRLLVRAEDLPRAKALIEEYAKDPWALDETARRALEDWMPPEGPPH